VSRNGKDAENQANAFMRPGDVEIDMAIGIRTEGHIEYSPDENGKYGLRMVLEKAFGVPLTEKPDDECSRSEDEPS